jgi:hypothetical protein
LLQPTRALKVNGEISIPQAKPALEPKTSDLLQHSTAVALMQEAETILSAHDQPVRS